MLRDRGLGTPSPSMEGRGDVGMAKEDPGRTTSTEFQVLNCFPRSRYPALHSGVDCLNCSNFYFVFAYIFFLAYRLPTAIRFPFRKFVLFSLFIRFVYGSFRKMQGQNHQRILLCVPFQVSRTLLQQVRKK